MSNLKRVERTVKDKVVIFDYPTLMDEALIETEIFINSRGQVHLMLMSPNEKVVEAANTFIALANLKFCVTFKDGNKLLDWNKIYDQDKEFVIECFKAFSEWRLSFREETKEPDKG